VARVVRTVIVTRQRLFFRDYLT